jgi:hypothetical protein
MNKSHATRRIFRKGVFQMTPDGMHLVPEECDSYLYTGPVAEAVAILYTPNYGVPGDISRPNAPYVAETQAISSANTAFPAFGLPGKMVSNFFVPIASTGDAVYGILVRPYPAQGQNASDPLGTAVPITNGPVSVLRKGYINVFCQLGTPAQGSNVYVRYQNPSGSQIVGGLEQGSTGNNYQLTGAIWTGPADASGNAEISLGSTTI